MALGRCKCGRPFLVRSAMYWNNAEGRPLKRPRCRECYEEAIRGGARGVASFRGATSRWHQKRRIGQAYQEYEGRADEEEWDV